MDFDHRMRLLVQYLSIICGTSGFISDKCLQTYSRHEAVVQVFIRKQNAVFNEDSARSQDEGEEQIDVDVVPGAVKLPAEQRNDFLRDSIS